MNRTIFRFFSYPSLKILRFTDPRLCGTWYDHMKLIWECFCDGEYRDQEKCKRLYLEHYDYVRRVVPKERLLEYDVRSGWVPVTKFLGLPEFEGVVARNTSAEMISTHSEQWLMVVFESMKNVAIVAALMTIAIGLRMYISTRF